MSDPRSILVVRRDNIGDLVCTTPLFAALRRRFPEAWIGVYANSYNAPILAGQPDIDEVIAYRKAKHHRDTSRFAIYAERVSQLLALRRRRLDWVLLATPADHPRLRRLARVFGPRQVAGFYSDADGGAKSLDYAVSLEATRELHEVDAVFKLAGAFGIDGAPPPLRIAVDARERARVDDAVASRIGGARPIVAIHISARKPSQRWPIERFAQLMRALHAQAGAAFMLFWSPGASDHPQHPGDDDKARALLGMVPDVPVLPWPTSELPALVAGLSACDSVICSDGGAMHIAAALGKPITCLFGKSSASRWRPWGVPYRVLQAESCEVVDVSVDEVITAWGSLATSPAG